MTNEPSLSGTLSPLPFPERVSSSGTIDDKDKMCPLPSFSFIAPPRVRQLSVASNDTGDIRIPTGIDPGITSQCWITNFAKEMGAPPTDVSPSFLDAVVQSATNSQYSVVPSNWLKQTIASYGQVSQEPVLSMSCLLDDIAKQEKLLKSLAPTTVSPKPSPSSSLELLSSAVETVKPAETMPENASRGLIYIDCVGKWDIKCGRGGASNHHPGNKRYRQVVADMKARYRRESVKTSKTELSRSIVDFISNYGGRFVKQDQKTGRWYLLTKAQARKKTSQALRETKETKWTLETRPLKDEDIFDIEAIQV